VKAALENWFGAGRDSREVLSFWFPPKGKGGGLPRRQIFLGVLWVLGFFLFLFSQNFSPVNQFFLPLIFTVPWHL